MTLSLKKFFFDGIAAEESPNVRISFNKKLIAADLDKGSMTFEE